MAFAKIILGEYLNTDIDKILQDCVEKGFREHEEFVYHINLTKVKKGKNDSLVGIVNTSSNETSLHTCFGTYKPVSS